MALQAMLLEMQLVDDGVLRRVEHDAKRAGQALIHRLVLERLVDDDYVARLLAVRLRLDRIDLDHRDVDVRVARLLPPVLAERYRVIPVGLRRTREGDILYIATSSPDDDLAMMEVQAATGLRLVTLVAADGAIGRALSRLYKGASGETPLPVDLVLPTSGGHVLDALPIVLGEIMPADDSGPSRPVLIEGMLLDDAHTDEFLVASTHEVLALHAPMIFQASSFEPSPTDEKNDAAWLRSRQETSRAHQSPIYATTAIVSDDIGLRSWLKERLARAVPDIYEFSSLTEVAAFAASGALSHLVILQERPDAQTMQILGALRDTPAPPHVVAISANPAYEVIRGIDKRVVPDTDDERLALSVLAALYIEHAALS